LPDYEYLHESEIVEFRFAPARQLRDVVESLTAVGFTYHGDLLSLDRTDHGEPWQSIGVTEVRAIAAGVEVYLLDESVDVVELEYLLATLPPALLPSFVNSVERAAGALGEAPRFKGTEITPHELCRVLEEFVKEIRTDIGEPGSHGVRIEIERTYPR
jgi:hypothetical protein